MDALGVCVSLALSGNFERQHGVTQIILGVCISMHMYIHVHCYDRRLLYEHTKLAMHKMMKRECSKDSVPSA